MNALAVSKHVASTASEESLSCDYANTLLIAAAGLTAVVHPHLWSLLGTTRN
jgi:hypothetical protein